MPLEALPPFAIIVGAITAIGGIQYAAHVLPMGKPKAVGLDNFDRLLERRDQRIREKSGLQKWHTGAREREKVFAFCCVSVCVYACMYTYIEDDARACIKVGK